MLTQRSAPYRELLSLVNESMRRQPLSDAQVSALDAAIHDLGDRNVSQAVVNLHRQTFAQTGLHPWVPKPEPTSKDYLADDTS